MQIILCLDTMREVILLLHCHIVRSFVEFTLMGLQGSGYLELEYIKGSDVTAAPNSEIIHGIRLHKFEGLTPLSSNIERSDIATASLARIFLWNSL
jgi:hypothetical protein